MLKRAAETKTSNPLKRVHFEIDYSTEVQKARSCLLARVSEQGTTRLQGLDQQHRQLHRLLHQTVAAGESNSCLLIGNRGSGKSMLVRCVLDELKTEFHDNFVVIRLNGLTETSDRLALNAMARQLGAVQQVEHTFSSFAESFDYILSLLKSGDKSTLPLVFVLEEFDHFAQHPKQALLYNLFDATQSAQNPMTVVGLTCRLDALDLLEKRVKSRFSHRQIYLFPPATFGDFTTIAKDLLRLPGDSDNTFTHEFNNAVEDLFEDTGITTILRRIFDVTKDLRVFYKICFEPISELSVDHPFLLPSDFQTAHSAQQVDSKTEMLKGVSLLELILIVSMKKLMLKDISSFNFQMVYDEYKELMKRSQVRNMGFGMKLFARRVALKAFESLQSFELLHPLDQVAKCPKEYRMTKLMLEPVQITEAVLRYKNCPEIVKKWGTDAI